MIEKRIYSLDVLRGFSLFGIIIMNIVAFSRDTIHLNPYSAFQEGSNFVLYALNVLFVHNSFYPIFAFLFGYGLSIMYANSQKRKQNFFPIVYRRLLAMLIFGILHGVLLFSGDILQSYALVGLIGVLFLWLDKRMMLIGAAIFFGLYVFIYIIPALIVGLIDPSLDYLGNNIEVANQVTRNFNSRDLPTIIEQTSSIFFEYFFVSDFFSYLFRVTSLLPLILLGMYAHRANIFEWIIKERTIARRIAFITMIIGLGIKSLPFIFYARYSIETASIYIGGVILAASYIIIIVLLCEQSTFRTLVTPISNLGKLSFSAYIGQSLMMFLIIYGFQWYGKLDLWETYLIALTIYIFELIVASIYLKQFKQGPLEWLWRKITYLK